MNEYRYELRDMGILYGGARICFAIFKKDSQITIALVYSEENAKLIVDSLNKVHDWNTKWTKGENNV